MSSLILFVTAFGGAIFGVLALWSLQKIGLFKRSREGPPTEDKERAVRLEVRASHLHEHVYRGTPGPLESSEFDRAFGLGNETPETDEVKREETDAGT